MNEDFSQDMKMIKDEILELRKLVNRDKENCFESCKLKLEREFNELSLKKQDRNRIITLFLIAILGFIGIPRLGDYITNTVKTTVEESVKKHEAQIQEKLAHTKFRTDQILAQITSNRKNLFVELVRSFDIESARNLIKMKYDGIDFDALDINGRCALLYAVIFGQGELVNELIPLIKDLDCSEGSRDGITPLSAAIISGDVLIAKKLIDNGANLNHIDKDSNTPLHYAVYHKQNDLLETMLLKECDANKISNKDRDIPLIEAARFDLSDMVKILLEYTDKFDWQNYNGETALVIAVENNNEEIAKMLCKKGADKNLAYNWSKYTDKEKAIKFLDNLAK